jgi:lysozyme
MIFGDMFSRLFGGGGAPPPKAPEPSDDDKVLEEAAKLAEQFEGFVPHPYQDPVGVWTIGYGSTRDLVGNPVTATTPPVTWQQANQLMERDLRDAMQSVKDNVRVPLDVLQEAALVDFVYNVGVGNLKASTLLRKLNAGDYEGAAAEFPKWNMGGGVVLAGLVKRRAAERAEFESA